MCIKALSINQKIMRCTDLETASRIFQEEFGKILENHAPVKVLQTRNHYLPYLSDETKLLMEERNAPTKIMDDDKIITSPKALANVFNKMFQDKVRKLRTQTRNAPKVNPIDRLKAWLDKKENAAPEFSLKTIDMVKLRTILKKL
jgi:hypothetical protein